MRRAAALLLLLMAGCGLQPVYTGGSKGAATAMLTGIDVPVIGEKSGYLVRQALLDRLPDANGDTRYRLLVKLDDSISGFGVRGDDSISRERRQLRARWQLVDAASGAVLIDEAARSDAGIDIVSSEYAVIAAENAALERLSEEIAQQIVARVALFARAESQR